MNISQNEIKGEKAPQESERRKGSVGLVTVDYYFKIMILD